MKQTLLFRPPGLAGFAMGTKLMQSANRCVLLQKCSPLRSLFRSFAGFLRIIPKYSFFFDVRNHISLSIDFMQDRCGYTIDVFGPVCAPVKMVQAMPRWDIDIYIHTIYIYYVYIRYTISPGRGIRPSTVSPNIFVFFKRFFLKVKTHASQSHPFSTNPRVACRAGTSSGEVSSSLDFAHLSVSSARFDVMFVGVKKGG